MVNEYLAHRDREQHKKAQESPLETTIRKGIRPSLRQLVLASPEVREHATTCQNFGIADMGTLDPVQNTPLLSPPQESQPLRDQEHSSSQGLNFEGQDYGTGKGVAITCMCGQTFSVATKTSYGSFSPSPSSAQPYSGKNQERQRIYS